MRLLPHYVCVSLTATVLLPRVRHVDVARRPPYTPQARIPFLASSVLLLSRADQGLSAVLFIPPNFQQPSDHRIVFALGSAGNVICRVAHSLAQSIAAHHGGGSDRDYRREGGLASTDIFQGHYV